MFPLDDMHSVCLGVMRKLLGTWIGGSLHVRLQARNVDIISVCLNSVRDEVPKEFNRKPRSLRELSNWKATEFRSFYSILGQLFYVNKAVYEHFLLLHYAISILVSPKHINKFGTDLLQEVLKQFVLHCKQIYGLEYMIYNIHILIHLTKYVKKLWKFRYSFCIFF